jgi:tetraacyldisaccharide 4'-kinase
MRSISDFYAAFVRRRREHYARRPDLRRRLRRPVISIGNLAVGGRGKTPMVACIAREMLAMGERPAILSRGYGRTRSEDGVVVVRDPGGVRSDLARAGDEPLMLARALDGACVLVSPDRYLAGRLAEHAFDVTVHVLDDGFQHLQLDRDIDVVLVGRDDVAKPITLPGGRLREPLDTLIAADAVLAADDDVDVSAVGLDLPFFRTRRSIRVPDIDGQSAFAVAGVAAPERFFEDLRRLSCAIVGTRAFADHHAYSRQDVAGMAEAARRAGAQVIVTTEKDYVRMLPWRPFPMRVECAALTMEPDPRSEFRHWLTGALGAARDIVG